MFYFFTGYCLAWLAVFSFIGLILMIKNIKTWKDLPQVILVFCGCIVCAGLFFIIEREYSLIKNNPYEIVKEEYGRLTLMDRRNQIHQIIKNEVVYKYDFNKEPGITREKESWVRYINPKSILVKGIIPNDDGITYTVYLFSDQYPEMTTDTSRKQLKFYRDSWMILQGLYPKTSWLCWEWTGKSLPQWGELVEYSY